MEKKPQHLQTHAEEIAPHHAPDANAQMNMQRMVNRWLNHFCRGRCGDFDRTKCGICIDYAVLIDYLTAKYHLPY